MSTASPLLPLFKEQLEAECRDLANEHTLDQRGHWLIYWYFRRLHSFTGAEVEEVFCDGGNDLGIDAIWFDDDDVVHFYQFKNPENPSCAFPGGEVDKVLAGLRMILYRKVDGIANQDLLGRVHEIYQQVRTGYRLHLVTSGEGLCRESVAKLEALEAELKGPSSGGLFDWECEKLQDLQERFYEQSLPAIEDPVVFEIENTPYMLRSGAADCYFFHTSGSTLANLYTRFRERLLERNIRVDQRGTAVNRSIEITCGGDESSNFLHFNNGVTFLCDKASHDGFAHTVTLSKAQVVNGGQTIRALSRAQGKNSLKADVLVPVRAITSGSDKDFANKVSVRQNDQNQMGTGFLRSTDQRVIQLDHALASLGWYLERREGEVRNASPSESAAMAQRIGRKLEGHVISIKEGTQAYTATFYGQPELAKKNIKKVFLSIEDGGYFERIFSADMTAEKFVIAFQLKQIVDTFVKEFAATKRKSAIAAGDGEYRALLGDPLVDRFSKKIHQVMPQCSLFLCGLIFRDFVAFCENSPTLLPQYLESEGRDAIRNHLLFILEYAEKNQDKADKSWPVLLKSNTFFTHVATYIQGIRAAQKKS